MSDNSDNNGRMALAASTGDNLQALLTLRDMLAERFDRASPRDSAGLARQIQLIMAQIAQMQSGDGTEDDKLADALNDWEPE